MQKLNANIIYNFWLIIEDRSPSWIYNSQCRYSHLTDCVMNHQSQHTAIFLGSLLSYKRILVTAPKCATLDLSKSRHCVVYFIGRENNLSFTGFDAFVVIYLISKNISRSDNSFVQTQIKYRLRSKQNIYKSCIFTIHYNFPHSPPNASSQMTRCSDEKQDSHCNEKAIFNTLILLFH